MPPATAIEAFDTHMKSKLQDLSVMHKKLTRMLSKQCPDLIMGISPAFVQTYR